MVGEIAARLREASRQPRDFAILCRTNEQPRSFEMELRRAKIPYVLLGFAPNFYMPDLPCTSVRQAEEAEDAARAAGLTQVRIGNRHLLGLSD